ncbi:MAG: Blue-light-activated protein [Spirochaetes bacterium ADurb.BinA120]|nr:MAG: Blue-light-activated protein [Spirochaetes bacterium ADurb.BinA120]
MGKKDDAAGRVSYEILWDIVNDARDFISMTTGDGNVLYVNDAGKKMIGMDPEEDISQKSVWSIYPERIRELVRVEALPFARQNGSWSGETAILSSDGREIPVSQVIRAHKKEGDEVAYYSTIIRDISKRKNIEKALQASENKFFSAFHSGPTMKLMVRHSDERVIDINNSYLAAIGYNREILIGRKLSETSICGEGGELDAILELVAQDMPQGGREISYIALGGERRTGLFSAETVEVDGQAVILIEGTDISDRKKAEEDLRKSESEFIKVYQSSPEAIIINRMSDGAFIEVNESALELSRYRREEVIGRTPVDLQVFARYRDYLRMLTMLRHNQPVRKLEFDFLTKYGDIRNGILSAEIIDFGGEPCLITSIVDNTDRKRAERALDRERERLAVTLGSIGDGVITTNMFGEVALVNRVAEKLTGWTQEEAYGKPLQEVFTIINEMTREPCENPVEKVLESGEMVELANHTVLIARDGAERVIADSGAPIRDREGSIIGVVLVFRDITEKQRIDGELRKMQQIESLGVLAGGIAHDFNNILTAILGNINLGRLHTKPGEKLHEILMEAEKSAEQARELTRQLLTLAKGGKPIRRRGRLDDLIRDTAKFALRGSNIVPEFEFQDELYQAEFDEAQMGQVIHNIVMNARQAMEKGGVIRIAASNLNGDSVKTPPLGKGDFIRITVEDSGVGIPEGRLPHIFDPYFTTKPDGTGLGLTTTFSIIRNHDGYIHVESMPNVGSRFSVYLPAATAGPKNLLSERKAPVPGRGRVLLMDDEELVRNVATRMMVHLGYKVTCVRNGEEAVEEFERAHKGKDPYDIVVLDLTVPGGMGGLEAIGAIRAIIPDVRAIVSSGYSDDPVMAEYKKYGFDEVVIKPYKIEELSDALHRANG